MTRLSLVLALVLAAIRAAAAAPTVGVATAGDPALRPSAARAALGALGEAGVVAAAVALDDGVVAPCARRADPASCAPAVAALPHDRWLVLDIAADPAVDVAAGDRVVTGLWLDRGGVVLLAERRFCERCSPELLAGVTAGLVGHLVGQTAPGELRTAIVVRSTPSDATVTVDGRSVGVTPATVVVRPGRHRVRLDMAGHRAEERPVEAIDGATLVLAVALAPMAAADDVRRRRPSGRRVAGWSLIGGGGALAVAGAALVLVDQDAVRDGGRHRETRDTAPLGTALLAGAAAAGGIGLWLLRSDDGDALAVVPTARGVAALATVDF